MQPGVIGMKAFANKGSVRGLLERGPAESVGICGLAEYTLPVGRQGHSSVNFLKACFINVFVKGHDFSRAENGGKVEGGLTPEGSALASRTIDETRSRCRPFDSPSLRRSAYRQGLASGDYPEM